MTFDLFIDSIQSKQQLRGLPAPLKALWLDGVGDWESAHEAIQEESDIGSALVHAYLHRKEGDLWNARHWYKTAGRKPFEGPLKTEWEVLVREFLSLGSPALEAR